MVELKRNLNPDQVHSNLQAVKKRITIAAESCGRDPSQVEICVATKYVAIEEMGVLAQAGITLVGENRAQDLVAKVAAWPDLFTWDFIGRLQSRKVKTVAPLVRLIHSVASDSVLAQLEHHKPVGEEVLVEINIAAESSKDGIMADQLGDFIRRCPVRVGGIMVMAPLAGEPEVNRQYFAQARGLAMLHGVEKLSMGTTQDFEVAVQEGATIVRIGTILFS